MKITVKNVGPAPTIVYTQSGRRNLDVGKSITAEFSDGQVESMKDNKRLHVSEAGDDAPDQDEIQQDDERGDLVREAESLGVVVDGRWGEKRIKREIEKAKRFS